MLAGNRTRLRMTATVPKPSAVASTIPARRITLLQRIAICHEPLPVRNICRCRSSSPQTE